MKALRTIHLLFFLSTFCGLSIQPLTAQAKWLDQSYTAFFPKNLQTVLLSSGTFPAFWWGFLVFDLKRSPNEEWDSIVSDCLKITEDRSLLHHADCQGDASGSKDVLEAWARDFSLREPPPLKNSLLNQLKSAEAQATLPGNPWLWLLKLDPLETYQEFLKMLDKKSPLQLTKIQHFYFAEKENRILIPIQFSFPPSETNKTSAFQNRLKQICLEKNNCDQWHFLGPHASTWNNERQVFDDVSLVSKVGIVVMLLTLLLIGLTRKARLFLSVPPVLIGSLLSIGLTILVFGSIHGLTLSFGTALIGLALDYGFHAALNDRSSRSWRANTAGLLTTLVGLGTLFFSTVPLLRQLMFFSLTGLMISFFLIFIAQRKYPALFSVRPPKIHIWPARWKMSVALVLAIAGVAALLMVQPSFDLSQFEYKSHKERDITKWLHSQSSELPPLLEIQKKSEASPLFEAHKRLQWANQHKINIDSMALTHPLPSTQKKNRTDWKERFCPPTWASPLQQKLFAPFIASLPCESQEPNDLSGLSPSIPAYLRSLSSGDGWLTLWRPKSLEQDALIRRTFPDAQSMRELYQGFPKTLKAELLWMAPLSMVLAFIVLLFFYRSLSMALLSVFPFVTGLGLFFSTALVFSLEISFVSLIALVMVFGFSLDYGIFVCDLLFHPKEHDESAVWFSLLLSVSTSLLGFAPLLFCHHPVLQHLGQALVPGTLGAFVGTAWGLPTLAKWIPSRVRS